MSTQRIKGTRLGFKLDSESGGRDFWADAISVVMKNSFQEDSTLYGGIFFIELGWHFEVTAIQSTDKDSLWTFIYENTNKLMPFSFAPHGNEIPTPEQPHFTGIVTIPPPPELGGQAGRFVEYSFAMRLPINQGPMRVTEEQGGPNGFYTY